MAVFALVKDQASQESVVNGCMDSYSLAKRFLCGFFYISATKEPVQPYNFVSRLHSPF